jgi:hypothetical protein
LAAERVEQEDWRGALAALREVQSGELKQSAALLAGVCHYHLGEEAAAKSEFSLAKEDPALADVAELFLGLLARREGNTAEARQWLALVARSGDPSLRQSAGLLQRSLTEEGRLSLSATAGLGYDSNVNLAPLGASSGAGQDGLANAQATVVGRPLGESGPFFQTTGLVRQQFTLHDFSLYGVQGAAGWEWVQQGRRVGGQYSYDYLWLGGQGYLSAHRLTAWVFWPLGTLTLSGGYDLRFERFLPALYADFSGVRHTLTAGATWRSGIWSLGLSYRLAWNGTRDATLTYLEQGPAADVQVKLHARLQGFVTAMAFSRPYLEVDPNLGLERRDFSLLGQVGLSYALGDSVALVGTFLVRHNHSNIAALSYLEMVTTVSVAANLGFF